MNIPGLTEAIIGFSLVSGALLWPKLRSWQKYPYRRNNYVLTDAEWRFMKVLDAAVCDRYRVLAKVRIADVVSVTITKFSKRKWQSAFNKISGKHFDFVLCDPRDMVVYGAIELDDSSHDRKDRRERDKFLDGLCEAIDLPLLRVKVSTQYKHDDIRRAVFNAVPLPDSDDEDDENTSEILGSPQKPNPVSNTNSSVLRL